MTAPVYDCAGLPGHPLLGRGDLPDDVRAEIRRLHRLVPRRNLRLAWFGLFWLGGSRLALEPGVLPCAAGILVSALGLLGLSIFLHEASHHLLGRSRALNRVVGTLCGLPVLVSYAAYQALHLRHHAHERSARDPDDLEAATPRNVPLAVMYVVFGLVGSWLYLPHVARTGWRLTRPSERPRILRQYAAILLLVVAVACWSPAALLRAWLLPLALAGELTNLRSLAEHGMTAGGNPFMATRSVRSNALVRFALCNLNYHLEHHLYPGVPWYHLPALQGLLEPYARLAGASVYRSYSAFLRDLLRVLRQGPRRNVRLLPREQRIEICG